MGSGAAGGHPVGRRLAYAPESPFLQARIEAGHVLHWIPPLRRGTPLALIYRATVGAVTHRGRPVRGTNREEPMSTATGRTLSAVAVLTLLVSGCTSSEPQTISQGVVSMTLKASGAVPSGAPSSPPGFAADMGSGPSALTIVVAGVSARRTDGTWIPLAGPYPQTVDLLALVHGGGGATLPADGLPEGSYDALQV